MAGSTAREKAGNARAMAEAAMADARAKVGQLSFALPHAASILHAGCQGQQTRDSA